MSSDGLKGSPVGIGGWQGAGGRSAERDDEWERDLEQREEVLARGEGQTDSRTAMTEILSVELAWTVPAAPAAAALRHLVIDSGDDLHTVAGSIGVDPDWAQGVLSGEIDEVDLAHVEQLCEGLHCTPNDLFGLEAASSIAHSYGPERWPAEIAAFSASLERLGAVARSATDAGPGIGADADPFGDLEPGLDAGPALEL